MKMNPRVKRKWLKALRSGEYRQGTAQLCTPPHTAAGGVVNSSDDYEFCCLGVLENLYHEEMGTEFDEYRQGDGYHSEDCAVWAGLTLETRNAPDDEYVRVHRKGLWGSPDHYENIHISEKLTEMNDTGRSFEAIANWVEKNL